MFAQLGARRLGFAGRLDDGDACTVGPISSAAARTASWGYAPNKRSSFLHSAICSCDTDKVRFPNFSMSSAFPVCVCSRLACAMQKEVRVGDARVCGEACLLCLR